jgi:predicted AAA+ superfamily ATPase
MPKIYHYRTNDKKEIDFIIEKGNDILAIEIKSSQTVKLDAFKHIIDFQKKSKQNIIGIVFYEGDTILPFGDDTYKRFALPLNLFF